MDHDILAERIESVFDREIRRLVNEIALIDSRLAQLGDTEEDEIERILLRALRKHLVGDLRELAGFHGDPYILGFEERTPFASFNAGVEAEA